MKTRIIGFFEVEGMIREVLIALERSPMDEKLVLIKAAELLFILRLCISQINASDSDHYPEKNIHFKILQNASEAITYKINTCTIEEVKVQVSKAYMAFGIQ